MTDPPSSMSKSVTFSFPPSSSSTPPTTTAAQVPQPSNYVKSKPQSTPQAKQEPVEKIPASSDSPTQPVKNSRTIAKKTIVKSVHAETGQLKMENGSSSTPFSNGYRLTKSIYQKSQSPPVNACTIAEKMRQQNNHQIHEHVQNVKCELASLHEQLLKLEDEIKLANKGKNALEVAIQDIRKGISINQQSISAQQKKRREEV